MAISRKQAPKRDIVAITKTGEWGNVTYHHQLACGHIEIRKRVAPAGSMACTWCVVASIKESELRQLTAPQPVSSQVVLDLADMIDVSNSDVAAEQDAFRSQGALAAALGVSNDSVDIVLEDVDGTLQVAYALVFLTSADVQRLSVGRRAEIIDIPDHGS